MIAMMEMEITFMPVDIHLPYARINDMLNQAGAKYFLTDSDGFDNIKVFKIQTDFSGDYVVNHAKACSEIAYIMFTSGTTGKPKGVAIKRCGLENFIEAIPDIIHFESGKKITCFTKNSFDIFFVETLMAAHIGLNILLADDEEVENGATLINMLSKADYTQMTPSRMIMLWMIDKEFRFLNGLKAIMLGGEAMPNSLLISLREKTKAEIYNMYGPVETTIWSSVARLTDCEEVNIGKPIKNTEIFILSENGQILQDGKIGEIVIGGDGLAAGYVGDDELTEKKFIIIENGKRVYRTGDLGKINADGLLECGGRMDSQVKIKGFRVELEEIETCIAKCFDGLIAVCIYVKNENTSELVACYKADRKISPSEFSEKLSEYLPYYMLPNKYVQVNDIPYTLSYKADRRAMAATYLEMQQEISEPKALDLEGKIYYIIAKKLGSSPEMVGYDVRLKDIGADSINIIEMIVSLEEEFDIEFEDDMLTRNTFYYCGEICDYVKKLIKEQQ